ncbi:Rrf2 family transcriptional regulator [Spongiactinospora sp. TRM90649]|uniref:RrF2 family transcriptional regulator n=1 Tax=Spongiactinospora sp. TRM90649 TaxID=3031114 RepID=UPI0023F63020|nr:Rrf2 family transcriptional regulator [Spongiactinospora sp. TRM90649]MDF5754309.1 Rrf2 family transcriptional regulator [Spongiactinospora sp. TRM90649]
MAISASTQYALRAAVALAAAAPNRVAAAKIASSQGIPRWYCSSILQLLRQAGLVYGLRGRGYWLARPPDQITVADIIRVTEGVDESTLSVPGAAGLVAEIRAELREHETALLTEITLADLAATTPPPPTPTPHAPPPDPTQPPPVPSAAPPSNRHRRGAR